MFVHSQTEDAGSIGVMRVRIVVPTYYPATAYGGPTFSIHNTAQALARAGALVNVSTTDANRTTRLDVPTDKPVEFEANYHVRYYRENITDRASLPFTRAIKRDLASADIVHLQDVFSTYALLTLWTAKRHKKPVVVSPRGVFSEWALASGRASVKKFWIERLFKPLVRRSPTLAWHATSEQEANDIRRVFGKPDVFVVPNGVDLDMFREDVKLTRSEWLARYFPEQDFSARNPVTLISMGRLDPVKGFDIALATLAELLERGGDYILLIAGKDGGAGDGLNQEAKRLGVTDRLGFVGELLDQAKIDFLKGGDIFLFPSHSENFGLACLESLAAGTPVVASQGTPWHRIEAEGAGTWTPNNSVAFADAVIRLLNEPQPELRARAKAVAAHYGYTPIAKQLLAHFSALVDGAAHA
jgi:glycosyltransferase involved in cell wall biosynthesis